MTPTVDLHRHYWAVSGDTGRVWSSAAAAYVPTDDAGYAAFLAGGARPTPIRNEFELQESLLRNVPRSAMVRTFTASEALAALAIIDEGEVLAAFGEQSVGDIVPDVPTLTAVRDRLGLAPVDIA